MGLHCYRGGRRGAGVAPSGGGAQRCGQGQLKGRPLGCDEQRLSSHCHQPVRPATPTATANAAQTATPTTVVTATSTPTTTPTVLAPGVHIVPNHTYYVDSIDYLHVVGEVQNNTANHLRFVKITANFFNQAGQLLDTDYTYIHLDNLPPGQKTCFTILRRSRPVGRANSSSRPPTGQTACSCPTWQWWMIMAHTTAPLGGMR